MSAAPSLLQNVATGKVFVWTPELAARPNMRVMEEAEAAEHLENVKRAAKAREAAEPSAPTREDLIRQLATMTAGIAPNAAAVAVAEAAAKALEPPKVQEPPKRASKKADAPPPAGVEQAAGESGQPSDHSPPP